MDEKNVPYIVFESTMARMERTIKRLWILCLVVLAVAIGTNIAWLYYESQFEEVVTTVTQNAESSGEGDATINDGVNIYGEGFTDDND